jgi:hypothetical protein
VKGFVEQVYCLEPYADQQGQTMILLQNAAGNRAISMQFDVKQLPYVTLWKNCNALEEGYVTGLEPGTGFPYNRRIERKAGRVPKLGPGQTRRFVLQVALHDSATSVEKASNSIEKLQAGRETQVDAEPFKPE